MRRSARERHCSGRRDARTEGAGGDSRVSRTGLPPGGALLRTAFSEVCGTDVHLWHGRLSGVPYPIIPGHVTTGTLDKAHGSLKDVTGAVLREGDRLAFFDVHRTCGGVWRAPRIARPRDAHHAAFTASPTPRRRGCSAAGRRRSTSSPESSSRSCRTSSRSRRTSAAAAGCSRRCTSSNAHRFGLATRSSSRARARWG